MPASPLQGSADEHSWPLTAFDESLIRMHPPKLEDRGQYVSDRVAWTAVLSDPDLIIADPMFLQTGGPPDFNVRIGDRLTVKDPISGASHEVTVAATQHAVTT